VPRIDDRVGVVVPNHGGKKGFISNRKRRGWDFKISADWNVARNSSLQKGPLTGPRRKRTSAPRGVKAKRGSSLLGGGERGEAIIKQKFVLLGEMTVADKCAKEEAFPDSGIPKSPGPEETGGRNP